MAEKTVSRITLTATDIAAGKEYLKSLRRLKFEPDAMCWIFSRNDGEGADEFISSKRIAIVTSLYDYAGPHALYDILFQAYDKSVTPKEIDPFKVALYSPRQSAGLAIVRTVNKISIRAAEHKMSNVDKLDVHFIGMSPYLDGVAVAIPATGILKVAEKIEPIARSVGDRFNGFKHEVMKAAA